MTNGDWPRCFWIFKNIEYKTYETLPLFWAWDPTNVELAPYHCANDLNFPHNSSKLYDTYNWTCYTELIQTVI